MQTATALGVTFPPSLLAGADEVMNDDAGQGNARVLSPAVDKWLICRR
jgi:hypothetical protein